MKLSIVVCLFRRYLLVRSSFTFNFDLKAMSVDITLRFKFHIHVFWNDPNK